MGSPFLTAWPQALLFFFFSSFSPLAFSVLLIFNFLSFPPLPFLRFPGSAQHSDPGAPGLACSSQRRPDALPTALHPPSLHTHPLCAPRSRRGCESAFLLGDAGLGRDPGRGCAAGALLSQTGAPDVPRGGGGEWWWWWWWGAVKGRRGPGAQLLWYSCVPTHPWLCFCKLVSQF